MQHEEDAERVVEPDLALGFRGFVITFGEAGGASVRALEDGVFLTDDNGVLEIADRSGIVYELIWHDIRGSLDPSTVAAISGDASAG